jgi:hypothetical protein
MRGIMPAVSRALEDLVRIPGEVARESVMMSPSIPILISLGVPR